MLTLILSHFYTFYYYVKEIYEMRLTLIENENQHRFGFIILIKHYSGNSKTIKKFKVYN